MVSNLLPTSPSELIRLDNRMAAGLTSRGAALGIVQITPASLGAVTTAEQGFNSARTLAAAASSVGVQSDAAIYKWLLQARGVLALQPG